MSIDWTKIAGYREDMTADEKLALIDVLEEGRIRGCRRMLRGEKESLIKMIEKEGN